MLRSARVDWAALLLRLTVGGLMLFHGYHKISQGVEEGMAGIKGMLAAKDLPEILAWGVYAGELLAPAMLVIGLLVPLAGIMLAVNMGVAIYLAHSTLLADVGGMGAYALEVQAFYLVGGLCCALLGAGRFSILGGGNKLPS